MAMNLVHDWKSARLEKSYISQVGFLGSGIRTSFLHAWVVTVVKVLIIFAFMNMHVDLSAKIEENVALLDRYVRDDFSMPVEPLRVAKIQSKPPLVILAEGFEPRGPSPAQGNGELSTATVAGDSTTIESAAN